MEFILNGRLGYDLTIIVDNTKIETNVTHTEWNRDSDGKLTSVKFREPNDEVTTQAVSLLEDIAYYRTSDIQHTDNLIVELFNKKSELDRKNLLMILNNTFGEEVEEEDMKFVCIKDVYLNGDGEHLYKKGNIYVSEHDSCITDETGNQGHIWTLDEVEITEFIPYSKLDKVYTKHTPLLEKIFDRYEGKKHEVSHQEIGWYCNCDVNDETGWFWGDGQDSVMEEYYEGNGFTYLSEQAFIEYMDLGKYIGSLNVEHKEEVKESERILSEAKQRQEEHDAINPQHYNQYSIQPLDYIEANGLDFCEGNVIKYVSRYKQKNGLEDLKKAQVYLRKLIDRYDKK